ncbi:MAG: type I pullulanase [Clostridiales bacterium]|nr:type I pullulanase [Clostridiales bacterium]
MKETFQAFLDEIKIITAEIDCHYYDGLSSEFKVIDEDNNYYETVIKEEHKADNKRVYKLFVDGLTIGKNYTIVDEHFLKVPLTYRYVVRTDVFDELFYYPGDDLGVTYTKEASEFRIWSPVASRVLLDVEGDIYTLKRQEKGVHYVKVEGDLAGKSYEYLLNISHNWHHAIDPYALSSTPNHKKSVVLDTDIIDINLNKEMLPVLNQKTDSIIYELHVRDFSSKASSGIKEQGKFLGLIEEGTTSDRGDVTGLDYLLNLGFTHLQLLPIYDFGSVDELNPSSHYNWGYDPMQFNVPEGSYASDVNDPYSRVIDLKKVVSKLHEKGLRVVMDVVYNHMFDRFSTSFESIVPYYYFRTGEDGMISNGSFCGNDFDSTRLMGRKYILDSIKLWMTEYGIDGFRFDLMGILDITTMNQVAMLVSELDPNAMVYGEGWNMPTLLAEDQKATMMNQALMPNIGHFNDMFRDTVKGGSMEEDEKLKGILLGDIKKFSKLPNLLLGSPVKEKESFFSAPWKSVNYVECHDNQTVYDKMITCEVDEVENRQKLMLATVLFSQGIPFIHAGQEFCRTKQGAHNSYMSSDTINGLDWHRAYEYKEIVDYTRDAIALRKETPEFRYMSYDVPIKDKSKKLKKMIEIHYDKEVKLIINMSQQLHEVKLKKEKIVFNKHGKADIHDKYTLEPLELIIIKKA